jgi:hypothetical protein
MALVGSARGRFVSCGLDADHAERYEHHFSFDNMVATLERVLELANASG